MPNREPLHAVIDDASGFVRDVIVCDAATAEQFAAFDPPVFPGASLVEVTEPGVGIGWHFEGGAFTAPEPPADAGPAPTPETPDGTGTPGEPVGGDADLRAQIAAQQESIDWLVDVVTTLATGGEIGGEA